MVTAIFAATGKKVDEDDPIIVGALFQAYIMREASREVADQIAQVALAVTSAVEEARMAVVDAATMLHQAAIAEKVRGDALEARVRRAVRDISYVQYLGEGPPTA